MTESFALSGPSGLGRISLARTALGRLRPMPQLRLKLALGRPEDEGSAMLARNLQRLAVAEELHAAFTPSLGRVNFSAPMTTSSLLPSAGTLWRRSVGAARRGDALGRRFVAFGAFFGVFLALERFDRFHRRRALLRDDGLGSRGLGR